MVTTKHLIIHGDGVTDDGPAINAWIRDEPVFWPDGTPVGDTVIDLTIATSEVLDFSAHRGRPITFTKNDISAYDPLKKES